MPHFGIWSPILMSVSKSKIGFRGEGNQGIVQPEIITIYADHEPKKKIVQFLFC